MSPQNPHKQTRNAFREIIFQLLLLEQISCRKTPFFWQFDWWGESVIDCRRPWGRIKRVRLSLSSGRLKTPSDIGIENPSCKSSICAQVPASCRKWVIKGTPFLWAGWVSDAFIERSRSLIHASYLPARGRCQDGHFYVPLDLGSATPTSVIIPGSSQIPLRFLPGKSSPPGISNFLNNSDPKQLCVTRVETTRLGIDHSCRTIFCVRFLQFLAAPSCRLSVPKDTTGWCPRAYETHRWWYFQPRGIA